MDFSDSLWSEALPNEANNWLRTTNSQDMKACGRGTQDSHCKTKSDAHIAGHGPGTHRYNDLLYRNKTIYVNPTMMRSGEGCTLPEGATLNLDWYQRDSTATAADIVGSVVSAVPDGMGEARAAGSRDSRKVVECGNEKNEKRQPAFYDYPIAATTMLLSPHEPLSLQMW